MSLRILWLNTFLRSPIFTHNLDELAVDMLSDGLLDSNPHETFKAANICTQILNDHNDYDLVALCEVWDEDCKAVIVNYLRHKYPHYVYKISGEARIETGLTEDSGLMLFSKLPFHPFANPDCDPSVIKERYDIETDARGHKTLPVFFTQHWARAGLDRWAHKGTGFIRLNIGRFFFNINWTHLQADGDQQTVRLAQLWMLQGTLLGNDHDYDDAGPFTPDQIIQPFEEFYVFGDFNIPGKNQPDPPNAAIEALFPDKDKYEEWTARFGLGSHDFTPMADVWALTTSEWDTGASCGPATRYDYCFANGIDWWQKRTLAAYLEQVSEDRNHTVVQHITRPIFPDSDHRAIAVDINIPAPGCCPRTAILVENIKIGPQVAKEGEGVWGSLRYPGSMQWYLIKDPGTYTFKLPEALFNNDTASRLAIDIYAKDDLTYPIAKNAGRTYREELQVLKWGKPDFPPRVETEKFISIEYYISEAPFYVRVFSRNKTWPSPVDFVPSGATKNYDWTGQYHFYIRKNDGSDRQNAITIGQNEPMHDLNKEIGQAAVGSSTPIWLRVDIGISNAGLPQHIEFNLLNDSANECQFQLLKDGGDQVDESSGWDVQPGSLLKDLQGPSQLGGSFLLINRLDNQALFQVGWSTNLQFLTGAAIPAAGQSQLVILEETGWTSLGSDDVCFILWADAGPNLVDKLRKNMDKDDVWPLDELIADGHYNGLPVVPFIKEIRVSCTEEGTFYDDYGKVIIHPLQVGLDGLKADALNAARDIHVGSGVYRYYYSQTWRRPNRKSLAEYNNPDTYWD